MYMGFLAPNSGVENGFLVYIEMAKTDVEQERLKAPALHYSFEPKNRLQIHVSNLAEKVCMHDTLPSSVRDISSYNKTKRDLIEQENVVDTKTQVDQSLAASGDDSTERYKHFGRGLGTTQVVKTTH